MIEFHDASEQIEWRKMVRAVLKGGSTKDGKVAVETSDYVLEQDRTRTSKRMEQEREENKREVERLKCLTRIP